VPLNPPTSLIVYLLDRKGADALANERECTWKDLGWDPDDRELGTLFVKHTLRVNDAFFTIVRCAERCGYVLDTWADGRALKRDHKDDDITITHEWEDKKGVKHRKVIPTHLYPDFYFYLLIHSEEGGKCHRFLEIDNATETVTPSVSAPSSWGMKVKRYLAYFEQGRFENRYHAKGMVVLTLTTNKVRLENLKRATEKESKKTQQEDRFWFATVTDFFNPDVNVLTDPIWQRAGQEGIFTFTEDL
jgi:hypothetical protein